jgi:hypothetical protein
MTINDYCLKMFYNDIYKTKEISSKGIILGEDEIIEKEEVMLLKEKIKDLENEIIILKGVDLANKYLTPHKKQKQ